MDQWIPRWFSMHESALDASDALAMTIAIENLDVVSARHRTDAMRMLASRYRADIERMGEEDKRRKELQA